MRLVKLIILFFITSKLSAQHINEYRFLVENHIVTDSSTGLYYGKSYEYSYKRVFYGDSTFKEIGLLGGDKTDNSLFFKIKNGCWYLKYANRWKLFYSPQRRVTPNIRISGNWYSLSPSGYELLNETNCLIFDVVPLKGTFSGDISYWFSPLHGIIKIKTNEITLIREDFMHMTP